MDLATIIASPGSFVVEKLIDLAQSNLAHWTFSLSLSLSLSLSHLFSQFLYTSSVYVSHSYLVDFKIEITRCKSCNIDYIDGRHTLNGCRHGNFAPPYLTCPSPLCTSQVFPAPQKWWGRDGTRFLPRTMGRGGDGFRLFRLAPSCPSPSPHC